MNRREHGAGGHDRGSRILAVLTVLALCTTSLAGALSLNFNYSYPIVNMYGHNVEMYGYGIYTWDTYFFAPVFIGSDICMLCIVIPLFIWTYADWCGKVRRAGTPGENGEGSSAAELRLISVYGVICYYAASLVFGVTYNRLFLVYVLLFALSLFGMFFHICRLKWKKSISASRGMYIFLILSGISLLAAWLPDIIPTVMTGETLSLIGVYTTSGTYVLDMGIISPLCLVTWYLLRKRNALGTLLLAILLKLCIIVGIMMIPQTLCQAASGAELPLPALLTKSLSFVLLGGFAWYFNRRMYRQLNEGIWETAI